jgi:hypothetical protein
VAVLLAALALASPARAFDRLLIITPIQFTDELEPLVRFKEASGRLTYVETLADIYATYPGLDRPEQVKWCIVDYEQNEDVNMVLLVGDVDKFPTRWTFWGNENQEEFHVTDLYYGDLYTEGTTNFETWDSNGNTLYGEVEFDPDGFINNDAIDYLPDVAVGRIAASNEAEVTAYVNKVIDYELRTRPDHGWFNTIGLYTGTWQYEHNQRSDEIALAMASFGFASIKRYSDWSDPNNVLPPPGVPGVIVGDFNGGLGFANYMGHGNSQGWACVSFHQWTLQQVANTHVLPVATGVACDTGSLAWHAGPHPYLDEAGVPHCGYANGEALDPGPYPHWNFPRPAPIQAGLINCAGPLCTTCEFDRSCMGETFQFGNPPGMTGAIAYLGERGAGQTTADDAVVHFYNGYVAGHRALGRMWMHMIEQYYIQYDLGNSHTWWYTPQDWTMGFVFDEARKFIVFGDPSLRVGGAYTDMESGSVWDWGGGGPWLMLNRYRVVGDVTVPTGERLTAQPRTSVLIEPGCKITGQGTSPLQGLSVSASVDYPVHFLSLGADTSAGEVIRGMVVKGELRAYNGGQIKMH